MLHSEKIIAIILNYNSSEDSIELYNEIKELYKNIALLVVDNNSHLRDKKNLIKHIEASDLIFNKKNRGYAGGNNVGIKKAIKENFEYVWILNPDIRIDKNTLTGLVETLESDLTIAAVGPRICFRNDKTKIYSDGGIIYKERGFYTTHLNSNKNISDLKDQNVIQSADYINGSVMLVRTSVLKKIGLMLEDFFLYFEETEWCLRAAKNKLKLLVNTNAKAYHTSSTKGKLYTYYMTRNRILLAKHQKEYYKETVDIVWKKVVKQLKSDVKKRKVSAITFNLLKGFLAGYFGKLKK